MLYSLYLLLPKPQLIPPHHPPPWQPQVYSLRPWVRFWKNIFSKNHTSHPLLPSRHVQKSILYVCFSIQFSSAQLHSCVLLFPTPWTAAHQASLFLTNSRSLFKLMSIELVMPSNHLILCCPLLLLPSTFPSISLFQWVSSSHQVAKELKFQLQHQSFQWIFGTDFL